MANIKRLTELLVNVVPFIPPRQLRMRKFTGAHKALPNGCGTVACIAGWAGVHPAFNAEGFVLSPLLRRTAYGLSGYMLQHVPLYGGLEMADAVLSFFDIEAEEFEYLFGEGNPNDPVAAAQRILDVIEANT